MMHGREKSDLAIVAMKPANKANEPTAEASTGANAAESVERRAGAKGNAHQQSTQWTQSQARVSQALERIRHVFAVTHPRWEPYAGKPHVRSCAGGVRGTAGPYRYSAAISSRCSAARLHGRSRRARSRASRCGGLVCSLPPSTRTIRKCGPALQVLCRPCGSWGGAKGTTCSSI